MLRFKKNFDLIQILFLKAARFCKPQSSSGVIHKTLKYRRDQTLSSCFMSDDEFKSIFPNLSRHEGLDYNTIAELAKENLFLYRDKSDKKSSSSDKWKENEKTITKGDYVKPLFDNCSTELHPLRFDRYPTVNSQKVFMAASKYFKESTEFLPTNAYDLSSVEMTNVITAKGIEETHKPESMDLSIRMFYRENFKKSHGGISNFNVVHNDNGVPTMMLSLYLGDIENIKSFHESFFNLYVFTSRVKPWDKSLEPLWKFFIIHNWFSDNPSSFGFSRSVDQGTFCAAFTDRILHANATRFQHEGGHLSLADIDAEFKSYCISNPKCSIVQMVPISDKVNKVASRPKDKIPFEVKPSGSTYINVRTLCRSFNSPDGVCQNSFDNVTKKCKGSNNMEFLHVCNKKMPSGRPCGQPHQNKNHT